MVPYLVWHARWKAEWAEWTAIRDEFIAQGKTPTAYQVTLEQRKRMLARGERAIFEGAVPDDFEPAPNAVE